jgi:regulator of PEP synthase PpsR (kinase-PPPase family)
MRTVRRVRSGLQSSPRDHHLPRMTRDHINLHLVSDATGETLNSLARACLAQYEGLSVIHHRWTLIRGRFQLDRVLAGIELEPGPVMFTMLDKALRAELESFCAKLNVPCLSVLDPALQLFADYIGRQGMAKPGRQYNVLDPDYFQRIDAMHYVLAHDDGQGEAGIAEADVILVGVSRSSKTPTSFYLANRGVKAANIPIVPGMKLPAILDNPPAPVIGLTIDVNALIEIRRHRLRMIGGPGAIRTSAADYVDPDKVKEELIAARRLCAARNWPVIDVTRRSIEETAATVLQHIDRWHQRKAEQRAAATPA